MLKIINGYYKSILDIHPSVSLGKCYLDRQNISIGEGTYFRSGEIYSGNATVSIGRYCAIGRNVSIKARTHSVGNPTKGTHDEINARVEEDIVIGDRVWIGDNVYIREGVSIGNDVIVGANSVVTKSVSDGEIVGGVPARSIARGSRD